MILDRYRLLSILIVLSFLSLATGSSSFAQTNRFSTKRNKIPVAKRPTAKLSVKKPTAKLSIKKPEPFVFVKPRPAPSSPPVYAPFDPPERIYNANLWYEKPRAPAGTGTLILLNSNFALLKMNTELSLGHIQQQIFVQFYLKSLQSTIKGNVVDMEIGTDWLLVNLTKVEKSFTVNQLSEVEALQLVRDNHLLGDLRVSEFQTLFNKFTAFSLERSLAGVITFPQLVEHSFRVTADKLVHNMRKSEKKMWWSIDISVPIPLIDNCYLDSDFKKTIKETSELHLIDAYICQSSSQKRHPSSPVQPNYQMAVGTLESSDVFLNPKNTMTLLNKLHQEMSQLRFTHLDEKSCISFWIKPNNIWAKSCVKKSGFFEKEYDAIHTFGFYKNKKVYYQSLFLSGFSSDNQKDIVEHFIADLRGNIL